MFTEDMDFESRLVTPEFTGGEDDSLELSLRPRALKDYLGQEKAKENLKVYMDAAKGRGESLDHVLLYGPPGLGNEGDVLFIDEIHRLSRQVEEILYPAMEDNAIDIIIGKGPSARSIRLELPHFTLVGATTRMGLLSAPMRDRFGVILRLELYSPDELAQIVKRSAQILGIEIDPEGAEEIACRSRGTPRIANRLLKRARDFAEVVGNGVITKADADLALSRMEIDPLGLDNIDRMLLTAMVRNYNGGPVGLDTIAAAIGEDATTIEDVYEPYLMQIGFLSRTPRGRMVTPAGYRHLGLPMPGNGNGADDDQLTL